MPHIFETKQIKEALEKLDIIAAMEEAFKAYSAGQMIVSPQGELPFKKPAGKMNLTFGYMKNSPYFMVKMASDFPGNTKLNKPTGNGMLSLFHKETGEVAAAFVDEGYLTAARTAAAGAVAAKQLAPKVIHKIGIFGTGVQALLQLDYLRRVTECRKVMVFGRTEEKRQAYLDKAAALGFEAEEAEVERDVAEQCNLIVTATSSHMPMLTADMVQPGTHITAVGATTPQKIELAPLVIKNADIVVVDSLIESKKRGEAYHAVQTGLLKQNTLLELGKIIDNPKKGRLTEEQITIADLTGLPAQDMVIAQAVFQTLTA